MIRASTIAMALLVPSPVATATIMSAPAVEPQNMPIPVDRAARRKFPEDSAQLVDVLAFINALVNATIQPESDEDHYHMMDLWVMAPADGKGDCEDYALTKYLLIENIDGQPIDPVEQMKIVGVMVYHGGHALLAVRLPSGRVMYLDNLNREPMTRAELVRQGYRFFDWKA